MTIDEQVRHDLFTGLRATVGPEPAKLMMTAIPPFSWSEIATKADLTQFATRDEIHAEFAAVRSEIQFDFTAVRGEFAAVRSEMQFEFAAVRSEMQFEFAAVRGEMHADSAALRLEISNSFNRMLAQLSKSQWNLFFQIATFNISTAGIVVAALHLLS